MPGTRRKAPNKLYQRAKGYVKVNFSRWLFSGLSLCYSICAGHHSAITSAQLQASTRQSAKAGESYSRWKYLNHHK